MTEQNEHLARLENCVKDLGFGCPSMAEKESIAWAVKTIREQAGRIAELEPEIEYCRRGSVGAVEIVLKNPNDADLIHGAIAESLGRLASRLLEQDAEIGRQKVRIAELEREHSCEWRVLAGHQEDKIAELEAEVTRLREALEPFAAIGRCVHNGPFNISMLAHRREWYEAALRALDREERG